MCHISETYIATKVVINNIVAPLNNNGFIVALHFLRTVVLATAKKKSY